VARSLTPLAKVIFQNNSALYDCIAACNGNLLSIQLSREMLLRIHQGLAFYLPAQEPGLKLLELCLQEHPLGTQAQDIAKKFNLDVLRGYYVAKELYISRNKAQPFGLLMPSGPKGTIQTHSLMLDA
jgi:hypothetical protein